MRVSIVYPVPFLDSVPIVQSLALKLAYEGVLVDLFVVDSGSRNNAPRIAHENVKIHEFQPGIFWGNFKVYSFIPRNILFFFWLLKYFFRTRYDHTIGVDPSGLAISGLVCFLKRCKFSYLSLELILWRDSARMFKGYKLLESFLIEKAAHIIIQDVQRQNLLIEEYNLQKNNFILFPNSPLGSATFTKSYWLHGILNLSRDTNIILYMGSWSQEFKKDWIVDLADRQMDNTVVVVQTRGKIDHKDMISNKNIIFLNFPLRYSELPLLVSSASIGLAFYDSDFSPNIKFVGKSSGKLTHYLFHGVPVICNHLPYWTETLQKYNSGLSADNADQLYDAVVAILNGDYEYRSGAITHFNDDLSIKLELSQLLG